MTNRTAFNWYLTADTTRINEQGPKQALDLYRVYPPSRPSSSSGSSHTLRRTPRFDEPRGPQHRRPQSIDTAALASEEGQRKSAKETVQPPEPLRTTPDGTFRFRPHPAVRVSRRAASAILYAVEEALRNPHPFTSDPDEENALMSELGLGASNGRANNVDSRATGPVPVVQPSTSASALRTPRDVMRSREEREARRRAEAEQQTREEDERRRSTERRAAAVAPGRGSGEQRRGGGTTGGGQHSGLDPSSTKTPLRSAQQAYPTPSTGESEDNIRPEGYGRVRATSRATDEPRPAPSQPATSTRRTQGSSSGLRQSSAPATTAPASNPTAQDGASESRQPRNNTSSFPHAFERWENLSSHWEGLTSYWLHKLESNQEQIAKNVPSASAMSRQITDLSAAGANLFHAVVELQRLRASSERKFQRWFFETRAEQERAKESQGATQNAFNAQSTALLEEREQRARAERDCKTADNALKQMRRELQISKEEARRAWEELGRREQEERDRTISLREGMPTVVAGVQVVPMHANHGMSGAGNEGQRPTTREGTQHSSTRPQEVQYEGQHYYQDNPSPTNTDPFTEAGRSGQQLHYEPEVQPLTAGGSHPYPPGSTPATSGSVQTAIAPVQQRSTPSGNSARSQPQGTSSHIPMPAPESFTSHATTTDEPSRFYHHPATSTNLYSPQSEEPPLTAPPQSSLTDPSAAARQAVRDLRSQASYISSLHSVDDEDDTEYELDDAGHLRRDEQGRPLVYRHSSPSAHRHRAGTTASRSEVSDDYDVSADVAREREFATRYGVGAGQGHNQSVLPTTSADAMLLGYEPDPSPFVDADVQGPSSSGVAPSGTTTAANDEASEARVPPPAPDPDYAGDGYAGYEPVRSTHHHPTRLSDVLEEEEEGRSRDGFGYGSRH